MRKRIFIAFIFITAISLLGLQVLVSHRLSNMGGQLRIIGQETEKIRLENELLKTKIASDSSMATITKRAKEMGFVNAYYLYLEKPAVALK